MRHDSRDEPPFSVVQYTDDFPDFDDAQRLAAMPPSGDGRTVYDVWHVGECDTVVVLGRNCGGIAEVATRQN